jgi:tripartite-type tricarboxylate transporter receptor subunit TctC
MMDRRHLLRLGLLAGTLAPLPFAPAHAQIGDQPIRIIFPFAPGGSGDALARLIGDKMRAALNRPVIVENRTGAAGRIGVHAVKSAAPDGNTLLITPIAPLAIYQHVYKSLDYDPIHDFEPLAQLATFDFGVAVSPQVTAKSLKELVAWTKSDPSHANFGMPAAGSLPHFLGIMFGRATGVDLRAIIYRGSAAALADLVAGHIPMLFTTTADMVEMHRAGRIHVLATSGEQRSPFLPDIPTFREGGYDLVAAGWYGMFAPAKTPADVIARLNHAIVDGVKSADVRERMKAAGLQPTGTSAAELGRIQRRDSEFWAPAIKASGFKPAQ